MSVIALDIGGAHIKWANDRGEAGSVAFALWREPAALAARLKGVCDPRAGDVLLVTMTAELCDCFASKAAGVAHVVDAVTAAGHAAGASVHVWSVRQGFLTPGEARQRPLEVAAGNWHALATWTAQWIAPARGVLIDVGSTTSDLIPLAEGACEAVGLTDTQRLTTGELVYLGAQRTPLMAVTPCVTLRGRRVGVMAEHFATMDDAMVLLGLSGERPHDARTADGRPMTRPCAARRVLRMIGADLDTHTFTDAVSLARRFVVVARQRLAAALGTVMREADAEAGAVLTAMVSGSGARLGEAAARRALPGATLRRLSDIIGPEGSEAACAHALVQLWHEPGAPSSGRLPRTDHTTSAR